MPTPTPRLPQPGSDQGNWGNILNDFLSVEHNPDGTLNQSGTISLKYTKPPEGIPPSDLHPSLQDKLTKVEQHDASLASIQEDGWVTPNRLAADLVTTVSQAAEAGAKSQKSPYYVAEVGDSIVSYLGGYQVYAAIATNQRLLSLAKYSYSGETSGQVAARLSAIVASLRTLPVQPHRVFISVGANDAQTGRTATQLITDTLALLNGLKAAGYAVGLMTTTPINSASYTTRVQAYVAWQQAYAATHQDVILVDMYAACADPVTGQWKNGYAVADGVHPNGILGLKVMGDTYATALTALVAKTGPRLLQLALAPSVHNLLANSRLLLDADSDGRADNWSLASVQAGYTYTLVPDTAENGQTFNWQRIQVATATNTLTIRQSVAKAGGNYTDGDTLSVLISQDTIQGTNANRIITQATCYSASSAVLLNTSIANLQASYVGLLAKDFIVPAGTTRIELSMQIGTGDGDYKFALPALVNKTTLNLD